MAQLTVKRARKILGNLADEISDEEIEKDIEAAELLKKIFFSFPYKEKANGKNV